jgi:iron complex outermembrane receptor protein
MARKTRSPNFDERYTWSTNGMAMAMIGWFGDSNRYVGNLDLKPETANTASVTAEWHDSARRDWQIKVTPYYSYVEDYIGVQPFALNQGGPYSLLRFTNQNAQLYGVDASGYKVLARSLEYGRLSLTGMLNYTHGDDLSTGNALYHMMPLNARIGLEHKVGHWTNVAELNLVAEKDLVDPVRLEPKTAAYALVNLRTSYELENIRVDFGVENLFNQYYEPPLGGTYIGGFPAVTGPGGLYGAVPGMGRNIYAGVTFKF